MLAGLDCEPWDELIILRGQDFMTDEVLDFLDECVTEIGGRFTYFSHSRQQLVGVKTINIPQVLTPISNTQFV